MANYIFSAEDTSNVEAWDRGELRSERRECEVCHTHWDCSPVHYARCPTCYPGHEPLAERLSDPNRSPGHRFVWGETYGPCGRWVTSERMWEPMRRIFDAVRELLPDADDRDFAGALRGEMLRLRAIANEVAEPARQRVEREQQRANRLADERRQLRRQLEAKRAQCDELRDENDRLRRAAA